jgi:hypothetical protein
MKCKRCEVEGGIYRQINSNGAKVVVERCPNCGANPNAGKPFLPLKDYDWESLPLWEDKTIDAPPCSVRGCVNKGTEYHHYAPRHLFEDADDWATGYLCAIHHRLWHERTNTGSYITRIVVKEKKK